MADNNLKLDVVVADVGDDGIVLSEYVAQSQYEVDQAKKADLLQDGKVDPDQLPDFQNLNGVTQKFDELATTLRDETDTKVATASQNLGQQMTAGLQNKADLVSGRVPNTQATEFKHVPGAKEAVDAAKLASKQYTDSKVDELSVKVPKMDASGKLPITVIPDGVTRDAELNHFVETITDQQNDFQENMNNDFNSYMISTNNKVANKANITDVYNKTDTDAQVLKINNTIIEERDRAVSQENVLQAQINAIGTGNKAYKTYAEMDANKATLPVNSKITVTNDSTASNNGDWQWNGTAFSKSAYDPYALAKSYADSNRMFNPMVISSAVDFNSLKTYGLHTFVSGTVWNSCANKPSYTNQWGQLFVLPVSATVVCQMVVCMNAKAFAMRLCDTANVWTPWTYYSDDSVLTTNIVNTIKNSIKTLTHPIYASTTKNILDTQNLLVGYELHATLGLIAEANSVTTDYIDVRGASSIAISGLQLNPQIGRLYRFLDKDENLVGTITSIGLVNQRVLTVPANAVWFQLSIKQRNSDPLNTSTAQIEYGSVITSYTAFSKGDVIGIHGSHIKQTDLKLGYEAIAKNLLNPATILMGTEVYGDGTLLPQAQSITTDLINVSGLQNITLSGLQPNPEIPRYYRFLDANNTLILKAQVPNPDSFYTITVPANAKWFQVSLLQRTATIFDISATQIESGTVATAYEAFKPGISGINGVDIIRGGESGGGSSSMVSRAFGASYLMIGDSITVTCDVENGMYYDPNWYPNWPTYAYVTLKMGGYMNVGRSGAAFREYAGQLTWQKISHQINTAIASGFNPGVIVLACGTNDAGVNLGDFDTAMSKPTLDDLNRALTLESMRWALWTLRQKWPNAVCFYCLPLQRADLETQARKDLNTNLARMARQYGFNVIDQYANSGIIKELEVWKANPTDPDAGTFLRDGLHPNAAGKLLQSNYICSEIIKRMMY
ncbi:hypothetical protein SHAb15599_00197 [Acinetobacter phage SH-Ab 15599]|nr:hypothetical protein SHAb15599_00197 [Acinetobacter phage SH-Ab 15599]